MPASTMTILVGSGMPPKEHIPIAQAKTNFSAPESRSRTTAADALAAAWVLGGLQIEAPPEWPADRARVELD